MRIVFFAPFGSTAEDESAASVALRLFTAFVRQQVPDITQIVCDNLIEQETNGKLSANQWIKLKTVQLSHYVNSKELRSLKNQINAAQFPIVFTGIDLSQYTSETEELHRISESLVGVKALVKDLSPDLVLISGTKDSISQSIVACLLNQGIKVMSFDQVDHLLEVKTRWNSESLNLNIIVDSLDNVRQEPSTWADELKQQLHSIVEFIGLQSSQLTLQLALK